MKRTIRLRLWNTEWLAIICDRKRKAALTTWWKVGLSLATIGNLEIHLYIQWAKAKQCKTAEDSTKRPWVTRVATAVRLTGRPTRSTQPTGQKRDKLIEGLWREDAIYSRLWRQRGRPAKDVALCTCVSEASTEGLKREGSQSHRDFMQNKWEGSDKKRGRETLWLVTQPTSWPESRDVSSEFGQVRFKIGD